MSECAVTLHDVLEAQEIIAPFVRRTPLIRSDKLSSHTGAEVYLKLESLQATGSFKIRGAANRLLRLSDDQRRRGVVTVSTGNHGRAVAQIAQSLNLRAVICAPDLVLRHKIDAIRDLGAEVVIYGASQDEAEAHALELAQQQGLTLVSPFDDPEIIAGQGVIGLELLDELPDMDTVVAPLSGGGLISGIAVAVKSLRPATRVVGVSMARGAVMHASLVAGHPVQLPEEKTLADSLMGGIGLENRHTFGLVRDWVDEVVLLSEEEIAGAMNDALRNEHLVVEGGGAVGLGALLSDKIDLRGQRVAVVVSGSNVEMETLLPIARGEWVFGPEGRDDGKTGSQGDRVRG